MRRQRIVWSDSRRPRNRTHISKRGPLGPYYVRPSCTVGLLQIEDALLSPRREEYTCTVLTDIYVPVDRVVVPYSPNILGINRYHLAVPYLKMYKHYYYYGIFLLYKHS